MTPGARPQPQLTPAVGHQPTPKPFHPGQKHACCSMPPAHNHLIYCSMPKITGLGRAGLPPKINNSHCLLPLQQHGCCQLPTGPGTAPGHGWDKPLGRCSAASPSSLPPPGNSGGGLKVPAGAARGAAPPSHVTRLQSIVALWEMGRGGPEAGVRARSPAPGGKGRPCAVSCVPWWRGLVPGGWPGDSVQVVRGSSAKPRAPVSAQSSRGEKKTHPTPVAQPRREEGAEIPPCRLGGGWEPTATPKVTGEPQNCPHRTGPTRAVLPWCPHPPWLALFCFLSLSPPYFPPSPPCSRMRGIATYISTASFLGRRKKKGTASVGQEVPPGQCPSPTPCYGAHRRHTGAAGGVGALHPSHPISGGS